MPGFNCGTHRRYVAGCHGCRKVDTHYDRRRRRLIKEGRWLYPVPAEQVLTHIEQLRRAGMSLAAIARVSGVARRTLYTAVHEPRKTIRGSTAAALLAVRPTPSLPVNLVLAVGTTRRIRALVAAGYSLTDIARYLDKKLQAVWEWAWEKQTTVTVDTHRAVADLYDRLSLTPGVNVRARNAGRRHGWAPPLAWDDAALDDPAGTPYQADPGSDDDVIDELAIRRALAGEPVRLTHVEKRAAVHRGIAAGTPIHAIGKALRMSGSTVTYHASKPAPILTAA